MIDICREKITYYMIDDMDMDLHLLSGRSCRCSWSCSVVTVVVLGRKKAVQAVPRTAAPLICRRSGRRSGLRRRGRRSGCRGIGRGTKIQMWR